jgi:hypothetical protein
MITYNVVPSIAKLIAIAMTAGVLALAASAPGWAQRTVNSTTGAMVDGKGGGGAATNSYNWANGAAYFEPHAKRINQASACSSSGSGRSSSCLHRRHHDRTGE